MRACRLRSRLNVSARRSASSAGSARPSAASASPSAYHVRGSPLSRSTARPNAVTASSRWAAPRRTRVRPSAACAGAKRGSRAASSTSAASAPARSPASARSCARAISAFASLFASPVSSSSVPAMRSRIPIYDSAGGVVAAGSGSGSSGASLSPAHTRCRISAMRSSILRRFEIAASSLTTSVVAACVSVAVLRSAARGRAPRRCRGAARRPRR